MSKFIFLFGQGNPGTAFLDHQLVRLAVVEMAMSVYYQSNIINPKAVLLNGFNQVVKAGLPELVSYMSRVDNDMGAFTP
jgi:hypothetical protein